MVANYFASPQELRDRIEQTFIGAPSNRFHPVIQKIVDGEATLDQVRGFARQFWAIPKYNLAVCGGKASRAPRCSTTTSPWNQTGSPSPMPSPRRNMARCWRTTSKPSPRWSRAGVSSA